MELIQFSGGLASMEVRPPAVLNGVARRAHASVAVLDSNGIETLALPLELVVPAIIQTNFQALVQMGLNPTELLNEVTDLRSELVRNNAGKQGEDVNRNQQRFDEELYDVLSSTNVFQTAVGMSIGKMVYIQGNEYLEGESIINGNIELDIQATKYWVDWTGFTVLPMVAPIPQFKSSRRRQVVAAKAPDPRALMQEKVDRLTAAYNASSGAKKASLKAELDAASAELNAYIPA